MSFSPTANPARTAAAARVPKTHVLLVLDMSGSMYSLADDVREGFNSYIDGLRADTAADYRVTASVFDTVVMPLCVGAKLPKVPHLTSELYRPRGNTALLDAIGKTITSFETRVPKLRKTDRVLLVVNTDGRENSSREFSLGTIRQMIGDREERGQWGCLYLGAGQNAWRDAPAMGFTTANTVLVRPGAQGVHSTYSGLLTGTRSYASGGSAASTAASVADEMTWGTPE
jgi:hypothetical protein